MSRWKRHDTVLILGIALLLRALSVAVTTLTSLNPYAQHDADGFANSAQSMASTITAGTVPKVNFGSIQDVWGMALSPFWLIPGPSRVYARIAMALLGAISVYNVYIIARQYHSKQAGIIAVLPMIVYPSFLFIHAAIIREAMVLFLITTITTLFLLPISIISKIQRYCLVFILLYFLILLRPENIFVYILVFSVVYLFERISSKKRGNKLRATITVVLLSSSLAIAAYKEKILMKIATVRGYRSYGRTAYLTQFIPDTIIEAVVFTWIGAAYFLFTPFPWMISNIMDFTIFIEGFINIFYFAFAILGVRVIYMKIPPQTTGLVVGIITACAMYGIGTVNVGTAVRHRPMVLWAIFVLAGIGISNYIEINMKTKV